jgi:hypothetical protein
MFIDLFMWMVRLIEMIEIIYIMEYLFHQEQELLSIVYREKGNRTPVKLLDSVTSLERVALGKVVERPC